ncbi:TetR/AcrR family transcriptional regulator [Nocardia yunnanensis]|uniref:TetR/AcrR family transcriptional regulator n=1 Tax=Nocardia yunnanensis TaxID=2382165 RepID=A0A386ZD64_9NOCA|nr:helix-turn-helix domain-containing protein [Nocardia yunnanensis]AYF75456.1 TetR/AcrR family transcriptional regulator [Nocardia yunnanensis]
MDVRMREARRERRRVILGAAAGLFAACGYRAASMEEVACRSGISKPVLYKSFSSKLELYLAVLHDALQVLDETVTAALDHAEGMQSIVAAAVAAVFDFADLHPRAAALLAGAAVAEEPAAQRIARQAAMICTDSLARALHPYPFAQTERRGMVIAELVAIAQTCARDWAATGKTLPKDDAVSTTAGLCWAGVAGVHLASRSPIRAGDDLLVEEVS